MSTPKTLRPTGRGNDGRFQKGRSGNPGGRPKGFAGRIQQLCGEDYERIAQGLYLIAMGTTADVEKFFGRALKVSTKDRIAALVALRDSGPGKPAQALEHRGEIGGGVHRIEHHFRSGAAASVGAAAEEANR